MKYWQGFLLYLAAFLLQPLLYNLIPVLGGNLNLLLCLTAVITFLYDDTVIGIVYAFIFGLAWDLYYGLYVGPGLLSLVFSGIVVLLLKNFVNRENLLNGIVGTPLLTWFYASCYWVIYYFLDSPYSYLYAMESLPLQLLFNGIAGAAFYFILLKRVIKHRRDRYFR